MTSLSDLDVRLRRHGCRIVREGGRHTIRENPADERRAGVPRHRAIPRTTARAIRRQPGVPDLA